MEILPIAILRENALTAVRILLMHTMGAFAQVAVSVILVLTLLGLRREGKIPKGFVSIAALISFSSAIRAWRLIYTWFAPLPPLWLNALTLFVLFLTTLMIPVLLSNQYVADASSTPAGSSTITWVRRAMVLNVFSVFLALALAVVLWFAYLIPLVCCASLLLSGALLVLLTSKVKNLQIRRRGVLLFAALTSTGLLGISASLFLGFVATRREMHTIDIPLALEWSTATRELCNVLIVLGMVFVFASLRLADVVVKRVLKLYIWCLVPFIAWSVAAATYHHLEGRIIHDAALSLFAMGAIASLTGVTHLLTEKSDRWVDSWVFQVPSFSSTIELFAIHLRTIQDAEIVYEASEHLIRSTLSIASAMVLPSSVAPALSGLQAERLEPYFLSEGSPLRSTLAPPPDVVVPLMRDGLVDHWIVLSQGDARPPLISTELDFIAKIAAEIQNRVTSIQAESIRLERLRREAAFREEIANAELRALRAQINPHFLFNSLNTIADLSVVAPAKAEEMTLRLAAVFRYVLVNGDRQFITVSEELDFVQSYLAIEETRFEDRLQVFFDVEPAALQQRIPTLLLQPLIENAIKHGISPRMQGGALFISAKRHGNELRIVVADDGVGLGAAFRRPQAQRCTHIGLKNVERRLSAAYGNRANFTLSGRRDGGTEATIVIAGDREDA
jgi:hypothetical protein